MRWLCRLVGHDWTFPRPIKDAGTWASTWAGDRHIVSTLQRVCLRCDRVQRMNGQTGRWQEVTP